MSVRTRCGVRERAGVGDRVEQRDAEAGRGAELDEGAGDRCRAGDPQERRREVRFHVDLQRSPGVAGHDQLDDPIAAPALGRRVLRQAKQARLAVGQRVERLADDDRLGARAADPALDRAVGVDDPVRPGPGRRRPRDRDDRRERERLAGLRELRGAREQAAPARLRRGQAVTPFSRRIAQTFCGVIGMSMLRTPRCHSASTTALAIAGGAPTVADSPTPFAPIG